MDLYTTDPTKSIYKSLGCNGSLELSSMTKIYFYLNEHLFRAGRCILVH